MLKRHMNLRSESRELEGNPLGLMNQFQKNPFTRSPSISTRVRRWEMLALTLSTSAFMFPTLWVWSTKTDSGTETRDFWLGRSVRQKSGSSFASGKRGCWSLSEITVGQALCSEAFVVYIKALQIMKAPWVVSSPPWLQMCCSLATQPFPSGGRPTEPRACTTAMVWGIVEDSTRAPYRGKTGQELSTGFGVS